MFRENVAGRGWGVLLTKAVREGRPESEQNTGLMGDGEERGSTKGRGQRRCSVQEGGLHEDMF